MARRSAASNPAICIRCFYFPPVERNAFGNLTVINFGQYDAIDLHPVIGCTAEVTFSHSATGGIPVLHAGKLGVDR